MQEFAPKNKQSESMRESETLSFLAEHGGKNLSLEDWEPGQPVLFVFPDTIYQKMSKEREPDDLTPIPSIVRIDSPQKIYFRKNSDHILLLENNGGQVDYFAIDPKTKKIMYVRSSSSVRDHTNPYLVTIDNVFEPLDDLFKKV